MVVANGFGAAVAESDEVIGEHSRMVAKRLVVGRESLRRAPDPGGFEERDFPLAAGTWIKAPPISTVFDDPARFQDGYTTKWKQQEPSNVVETVAVTSFLGHVVRGAKSWGEADHHHIGQPRGYRGGDDGEEF